MTNFPRPRRFRDDLGIMIIDGGSSMGKFRLPPMPPRIALTDNITGQIKVLSHDSPLTAVVLTAPLNNWSDVIVYGPDEGPSRYGWMLYLSNGVLAFKQNTGAHGAPILTRRSFDTTVIQIEPYLVDGQMIRMTYDLNNPEDPENRLSAYNWRAKDALVSFPSLDRVRITSVTNGVNPRIIKGPIDVGVNYGYDYLLPVWQGTQSGNMILRISTSPALTSGWDNSSATTTVFSDTYLPGANQKVWFGFIAVCSTAGMYADCKVNPTFKQAG